MADIDPIETQEWLSALASVIKYEGKERAKELIDAVLAHARQSGVPIDAGRVTEYVNSIAVEDEAQLPDDDTLASKVRALIRWNAIAMVVRAGKKASELGGHIATYASAALLYETGFNYFFRARSKDHPGDLVYIQGHSSPGIYARAFLEGRLSEEHLEHFRQEVGGKGISSYPHPWLMDDFWQFPTVSMGLGPLQAIYQARFLKYLENRGLVDNKDRKVWAFLGDGEMDEPESLGALSIAAREKLDNLIFVVNCNLQRLDGPVRGNGKVVQELEGIFKGANWRVIKCLWGSQWDPLFKKDTKGVLKARLESCVDGEFQKFEFEDGAYIRENLFGASPELSALVKDMTDEELKQLRRGGHDPQKVYATFAEAVNSKDGPTVVLIKTIKGFGMGAAGEGQNITHNVKKMSTDDLQALCERFDIPIPKDKIKDVPFYMPDKNSAEMKFLHEKRKALGGYLPARHAEADKLKTPALDVFKPLLESSGDREISTTMAFVRALGILLKDKNIKERIVPIVPDESRTFGMEGLFRQIGIYSPVGQLYEPQDKKQLMYYREDKKGQLLEEGINEAGAFASWMAAGNSYSVSGLAMIPFYIYYSMFGFQRIGDLAWAAGDMRCRGFLLGATAGKTTLAGEGLQHDDGTSHVWSSVIPCCVSYDPTYAYELAVIIRNGLYRMYQEQEDVYFYITLMNENYTHPEMPKDAEEGILKGMYLLKPAKKAKHTVQLLGSGTILREAEAAADLLKDFDVAADIWSVTSFTELCRDAQTIARENHLHPTKKPKQSYVQSCLSKQNGPVIAATDYVKMIPNQIREYVDKPYYVLGTDGFGRSDTRKALRHHFEVDAKMIAYTALKALADQGDYPADKLTAAMKTLGIDAKKENPFYA